MGLRLSEYFFEPSTGTFMQLYITEQGARINKFGNHLMVLKEGRQVGDFLLPDIESVSLFGAVHPTTEAMLALLEKGADIAFLSYGGHYRGRLTSGFGKNVFLRLEQFEAYRNPARSFSIAKSCVMRKLENGLRILDAYHRNCHNQFRFDERNEYLGNLKAVRDYCGVDRDILRGYEGNGARLYFKCFARCLSCDLKFPGREYRPCKDPVNALLSLGYSLVTRSLTFLAEGVGLDPMIGFLHEPSYGRNSLACDLVEEFRQDENGLQQVFLTHEGMKKFLRYYEEYCESPNRVCRGIEDVPWRKVMRMRVDEFRRSLQNNDEMEDMHLLQDFKEIATFESAVEKIIDANHDSVRIYPLDAQASEGISIIGVGKKIEQKKFEIL